MNTYQRHHRGPASMRAMVTVVICAVGAGCTGPPPPATGPPSATVEPPPSAVVEPPIEASFVVRDLSTFALPLDAYSPTREQDAVRRTAKWQLAVACMARLGFVFAAPPPTPQPLGVNEKRYGLADAGRAASYGYRDPEFDAMGDGEPGPRLSPAEFTALNGAPSDAAGARTAPAGGCSGEAEAKLLEGAPELPDPMLLEQLSREAYDRGSTDSRTRKANAEWSACMRQAGYSYPDPLAANDDEALATDKVTGKEIAVAVADVACKTRTKYINVRAAVETAYQKLIIELHADDLMTFKASMRSQLRQAALINAGKG